MNLLSLFSGGGGMDIGFEGGFSCLKRSINTDTHNDWIQRDYGKWVKVKPTKFNIVFANDINLDAKTAWVQYFKKRIHNADKIYHLESIVDLVKKEKQGKETFPSNIDIVTGGFPCQDFSIAGKRQGLNSYKDHLGIKQEDRKPTEENRGKLYMWMRDVITITKPKLFVAENVKGLFDLFDIRSIIEQDFSNACNGGYLVLPARVLNSSNYGVPQNRERVIFFGFKKEALTKEAMKELTKKTIDASYDPYPIKTHGIGLEPFVTCGEALKGLKEPCEAIDMAQQKYSKAKFMGRHCQGQTEIKLNSVGPTIRSEHHGNIEYRRLSIEHGGQHINEIKNGLQERRLTIRECARIQTFPDNYQFIIKKTPKHASVSSSSAYKIIGNAVPCVMAYNIAKNLESKWKLYFRE